MEEITFCSGPWFCWQDHFCLAIVTVKGNGALPCRPHFHPVAEMSAELFIVRVIGIYPKHLEFSQNFHGLLQSFRLGLDIAHRLRELR